jgi:hypothetical protein
VTPLEARNRTELLKLNAEHAELRLTKALRKLRTVRANRGDTTEAQRQVDFHADQVEWINGLLTPKALPTPGSAVLVRGRHAA